MIRDINDYHRVTEILRPFSGIDSIPIDVLMRAADRGTQVHLIVDAIIEGLGSPAIPEELEGYIDSFNAWNEGKKYIAKPERFFDDDLMITGECDAVIEEDGLNVLIDFKTPAKESHSWCLQGNAYAMLAKKCGHQIDKIKFVKLDKFGQPPCVYEYLITDFAANLFLSCVKVYEYFELHKTRRPRK